MTTQTKFEPFFFQISQSDARVENSQIATDFILTTQAYPEMIRAMRWNLWHLHIFLFSQVWNLNLSSLKKYKWNILQQRLGSLG